MITSFFNIDIIINLVSIKFLKFRKSRVMRKPRLGNILGETDFKALEPHLKILDQANIHTEHQKIQRKIEELNTRLEILDRSNKLS